MAAPRSTADLFSLIRKSELIDQGRLRAYWDDVAARSQLPSSPHRMAARMINDGMLTQLQARLLLKGKWKNFFISGKYKLLEHIGAGGMGQVFLCEHLRMGRRVALKILPTEQAENDTNLQRFYREARAAAVLDHPNIVRAHDIDRDCELHFLVMEYAEGSNLQEVVRGTGPLPISRAVDYAIQAACGLHHAHMSGLIHRDVKPSNLLLERNGQVKLLDLGLARFFDDASDQITQQIGGRSLVGTADFLSPEQAIDSQSADARSDIYSLGATLYYMLAGHAPFQSATIAEKLLQHQNDRPEPLRDRRPEVPVALAAVVDCAMAKNPNDRFADCVELVDALLPFVPAVVPVPDPEEMPKWCIAAQSAESLSGGLGQAPKSSLRMMRPPLTPPRGYAQPPTTTMTAASPHSAMQRALIAASICVGGLLFGVVMGKLASPVAAHAIVADGPHDNLEEQ